MGNFGHFMMIDKTFSQRSEKSFDSFLEKKSVLSVCTLFPTPQYLQNKLNALILSKHQCGVECVPREKGQIWEIDLRQIFIS